MYRLRRDPIFSEIEQYAAELGRFEDWKLGTDPHFGFHCGRILAKHWRQISHFHPSSVKITGGGEERKKTYDDDDDDDDDNDDNNNNNNKITITKRQKIIQSISACFKQPV